MIMLGGGITDIGSNGVSDGCLDGTDTEKCGGGRAYFRNTKEAYQWYLNGWTK